MSLRHSISQWIAAWRRGDQRAADQLWNRYYRRAAQLARRRMRSLPHGEEEDVAAQALHSLLQRTARGTFDQLCSRDDFWRLLMTITRRKAIDHYRRFQRQHRAKPSSAVVFARLDITALDKREDPAHSPAMVATYNDTLQQLLANMDDELRAIIERKLAGYTNVEIAAQVNRSLPTVERRLRLVRQLWLREALLCPAE